MLTGGLFWSERGSEMRPVLPAALIVCATIASGQSIETATLTGSVHDPSGAVIGGAVVRVRRVSSAKTPSAESNRSLSTNINGEFSIELAPGRYEVCADASGFRQDCQKLEMVAGQEISYRTSLSVGYCSGCGASGGMGPLVPAESFALPDAIPLLPVPKLHHAQVPGSAPSSR